MAFIYFGTPNLYYYYLSELAANPMSEWMYGWMDGWMSRWERRQRPQIIRSLVAAPALNQRALSVYSCAACSVGTREEEEEAEQRQQQREPRGRRLWFSACSFLLRELLISWSTSGVFFGGKRSGAIFSLSFETEQGVCKSGFWELLFCSSKYLYVNDISMLNCTWVSQGSEKYSFCSLDKEG